MVSEAIKTRINEAVKFSEDYPESLRPAIVSHLLAAHVGTGTGIPAHADRGAKTPREKEVPVTGTLNQRSTSSPVNETNSSGASDWFSKLAVELDVPEEKLREIYEVTDDGTPRVRAILQHDSLSKRQIGYTLLQLLANEKAGKPAATSDELRQLAQLKKAYDTGNFTRNFKVTNKLRAYGNPGQGNTEWVLTAPGRDEGRRLIKELCSGEAR
jgi:hypothetical protein